jgi:ABC-2 type transport system permease protein
MILNLLKNELVKIIKRKRSYISFSLIIVLIPFIVGAIDHGGNTLEKSLYGQLADSFLFVGSLINGYLATYIIIAILISHMPFLSTIVASEIVSGEYSKSTFRMYLSRPISRRKVLLSKLIIVFIYTTLLMFFFIFYSLLISTLWLGKGDLAVFHKGLLFLSENDVIWRFLLAFILSNIVMITVSSLCFFISTISSNSVTPIIITISIVFIGTAISLIPIDLFQLINPYLFTGYINIFLTAFYDPIPWFTVLKMTIVCSFWSFIFILLSFYIFEKRDITE